MEPDRTGIWGAPRPLAPAFVPALAAILMLAVLRAGAPPSLTALMALALIAGHPGHPWLAGRLAAPGQP